MGKKFKRLDLQRNDDLQFTPQGFLKVPVRAGRTGIQEYLDEKGNIIRELRLPEEVFRQETMDSLALIPVTNDHPTAMVDSTNARFVTVGATGETVTNVEDKFLETNAVIFDKGTIEDVRKGKVEVSLGYDVELEETSGVYEGQEYDVIQRNIVHNHLAIVDKGRAGSEVRLRLDSDAAILKDDRIIIIQREDSTMKKIKIDGKNVEVTDAVAAAFKLKMDEADKLKAKLDQLVEEKKKEDEDEDEDEKKDKDEDEMKKEDEDEEKEDEDKEEEKDSKDRADKEAARADAAEAKLEKLEGGKIDEAKVDLMVRDRTNALRVGAQVLDSETLPKMDTMSTKDLKRAIVETDSGTKMDGKSNVYIDARFDHIAESTSNSGDANTRMSQAVTKNREDSKTKLDADKKRLDSMKKDTEKWKAPVGKSLQSFKAS